MRATRAQWSAGAAGPVLAAVHDPDQFLADRCRRVLDGRTAKCKRCMGAEQRRRRENRKAVQAS